ncbi:MAG: DDE-type integrase/transposase/recombinase [Paenibacillus sp.]|nr:DDE-type integrase/transposase/recombinase [Paenibacillus sp.]
MPTRSNEVWAADFIFDAMAHSRCLRCLTVVDVFSRECLAIEANLSIPDKTFMWVLGHLKDMWGIPGTIIVDNGPEFTGRDFSEWAMGNDVRLTFIRPGKPIENSFIEIFNGSSETSA